MRPHYILISLITQSCNLAKPEVLPEKVCYQQSFNNEESKLNGKYTYDDKHRLLKFESNWKDFNFSVATDDQKLTSKYEISSIGTIDCAINPKFQIISATSSFGKFLITYKNDNIEEIIFESIRANTNNTKDSKWIYNFETENSNIKKAYLTLGSTISKRLIFEGMSFDNNPNLLPLEARNTQLFRTLINIVKGGEILDFDYLCKNNIVSKKYYRTGEPLITQDYSYQYNNEGYVTQMKYSATGKVNYSYMCE